MYDYYELLKFCDDMGNAGCKVGVVGKSEWGHEIPYLHIGNDKGKQLIITGGIHARECVSAYLCARLCQRWHDNTDYGIYFLPMLNPDGNLLVCSKAKSEKGYGFARFLNGSDDFSTWKANGEGVDLNVNFDARWGTGKSNSSFPSYQNYIGLHPFSAKESQALRDFTYAVYPCATLSYHSKGRELYWFFHQKGKDKKRDKKIADALNQKLNYKVRNGSLKSAGGYKDWCVDKLKIPAFTVEIGSDDYQHPLENSVVDEEWERHEKIPIILWEKSQ